MRSGEILASLPGLPMLILINATLRPRFVEWVENLGEKIWWTTWFTDSGFADYFLIFFVLSLFGWVGGARLIRTMTLTLRAADYVRARRVVRRIDAADPLPPPAAGRDAARSSSACPPASAPSPSPRSGSPSSASASSPRSRASAP